MNITRNLSRLTVNIRLITNPRVSTPTEIFKSKLLQVPVQQTVATSVRLYAKGKDKKKDKGKKTQKVEINENLIRDYVDLEGLNTQYQKCVDIMREEFIKNLSIRSTTGSIESLKVPVDGKVHELHEIGQIIRKNPKTIIINMISFPQAIQSVLQSLQKSGMNLNPQQDGTTIFVPVPKVTKEHRENLAKNAKTLFVKCRDSIRDVQNVQIKKLKRNDEIPSDDSHLIQAQVTSIADKFIVEAEKLMETKQSELIGSGKE